MAARKKKKGRKAKALTVDELRPLARRELATLGVHVRDPMRGYEKYLERQKRKPHPFPLALEACPPCAVSFLATLNKGRA